MGKLFKKRAPSYQKWSHELYEISSVRKINLKEQGKTFNTIYAITLKALERFYVLLQQTRFQTVHMCIINVANVVSQPNIGFFRLLLNTKLPCIIGINAAEIFQIRLPEMKGSIVFIMQVLISSEQMARTPINVLRLHSHCSVFVSICFFMKTLFVHIAPFSNEYPMKMIGVHTASAKRCCQSLFQNNDSVTSCQEGANRDFECYCSEQPFNKGM